MIFWYYAIILTQVTQCRPLRSIGELLNQTENVKEKDTDTSTTCTVCHMCVL